MISLKILGLGTLFASIVLLSPWVIPPLVSLLRSEFHRRFSLVLKETDDLFLSWDERTVYRVLTGILVGLPLVIGWVTRTPWLAFAGLLLGLRSPGILFSFLRDRRRRRFNRQLVDSLGLLASGMRSGLSFQAALLMAVEQLPAPASEEFSLVLKAYEMGEPLDKALEVLLNRVWSEDLEMAVTSVRILRRVGGNLPEQFDTVVQTLRERQRVEGKIHAITAQGRYQTVSIGLVGLALAAGLWIVSPEMMRPLVNTVPGRVCLGISGALFCCAVLCMRRLSRVRV